MDDPMAMQIRDSFEDIGKNRDDFSFLELLFLPNHLEQVTAWAVLHNEINIVGIMEKSIKFDDIGMVEIHLYLYFADEWNL